MQNTKMIKFMFCLRNFLQARGGLAKEDCHFRLPCCTTAREILPKPIMASFTCSD